LLKPHFNVLILRLLSAKLKQVWFCNLDPVSDGPLVYRFHAVGAVPHCGGAGPKQYGRRVKTLVGLVASRRDYLCNHLFLLAVDDLNRLRARVGADPFRPRAASKPVVYPNVVVEFLITARANPIERRI
jgi:hypothetical protein